jgi:hypothetical protein
MRPIANRAVALFTAASVMALSGASIAAERYAGYEGTAFELESGKLIYSEAHFLRYVNGKLSERVVMYRCPNGKAFGRKLMQVKGKTLMPEFELIDQRMGYREGLQTRPKGLTVFYQNSARKSEKSDQLDVNRLMVADAGFDEFVRQNWRELLAGKSVALDFIVPSQLDYLAFKVKWVKSATLNGELVQVFKLAPSGILGWVTSGLDVTYADSDRSLRQFSGLSNIRDITGDNYEAKIEFARAKQQNFSDARQFSAARSMNLVSSCQ